MAESYRWGEVSMEGTYIRRKVYTWKGVKHRGRYKQKNSAHGETYTLLKGTLTQSGCSICRQKFLLLDNAAITKLLSVIVYKSEMQCQRN